MPNLKVFPLDLGDIQLDESFVNWQQNCGNAIWAPTTGWLILGSEKPILVDSSFRSVDEAKRDQGLVCRRSSEQELEAQLAKRGVALSDVGYLVYTHLHMDHAGQDFRFYNAKVLTQRKEVQNAAAPNFYPAAFYDRVNVARLVAQVGAKVQLLDGDSELFPGISTKVLPGHTPAHQIVLVETAGGTVIIAGDSAMNMTVNVRQMVAPGIIDSMSDVMSGLRYLAKQEEQGARILPTHDSEVYKLYPHGLA